MCSSRISNRTQALSDQIMTSDNRRQSDSSWINFDQPFEGFTVDRSLIDGSLKSSPGQFWLPPAPVALGPQPRGRTVTWGWFVSRLLIGLSLAVLVLIAFGGFTAYRFSRVAQSVFRGGTDQAFALSEELDPRELTQEGDSRVNLLLIGRGGPGHEGPDLTDSIIIVSIDPNSRSASLLSLPRDWQVALDYSPDTWVRINSVYAFARDYNYVQTWDLETAQAAGLESLETVIETNLGIRINYHIFVDFGGFVSLIDALGGVELDIPRRLYDTRAELDLQPGLQTLNGTQALAYARARYTVAGGDFGRSANQRELILALKAKASASGLLSNFFRANQIADALGNSVVTNLSFDEAKRLYRIIQGFPLESLDSIDLVTDPVLLVPVNDEGRAVLWPAEGRDNYSQIQQFVSQQLSDSFISQEAASLFIKQVGSAPDQDLIERLKSYGYQISGSGQSEVEVEGPTLVSSTDKAPYTTSYLVKRFGATVAGPEDFEFNWTQETGPPADLVLILSRR